jgi:hypothetical protein
MTPLPELIARLEALGYEMPQEIRHLKSAYWYSDNWDSGEAVPLSDQHARDLICADVERWLRSKGRYVGVESIEHKQWRATVGGWGEGIDADPLTALTAAAEAAMKGGE